MRKDEQIAKKKEQMGLPGLRAVITSQLKCGFCDNGIKSIDYDEACPEGKAVRLGWTVTVDRKVNVAVCPTCTGTYPDFFDRITTTLMFKARAECACGWSWSIEFDEGEEAVRERMNQRLIGMRCTLVGAAEGKVVCPSCSMKT